MRVLIVKLSSLGDIVHTLPVIADIGAAYPEAIVDWVVEPAFAPLLERVRGVRNVVECDLRRWSRAGWWQASSRAEIAAFVRRLRRDAYDAVLDMQGLSKSAVIARLARGSSFGLANRTEGASHEWPARVLVDRAIRVEPRSHALDRGRELVARALAISVDSPPDFGLVARAPALGSGSSGAAGGLASRAAFEAAGREVAFVHGTSRADKLWPEPSWIELGRRIVSAGGTVALPQAGAIERERATRIAAAIGARCTIWPEMDIGRLVDRLATTTGVVGVDSGPSHIATALGLPHVQLYNFATAWRTGPQAQHGARHQVSVEGTPQPSVESAWSAWQAVSRDVRADAR